MIAELVSRLIAAGVSPEVAAVTITEAFAAGARSTGHPVDTTAEKRRAYDRERKAQERAERQKSGGSPVESGGSPKTPLTLTSSPHKDSIEEDKKVRARKRKSAELPPDWQPSEVHFAKAAELGVSREAVLSKAEDMRLWARSSGSLKADWDATFHGFVRRDADRLRATNGKQNIVDVAKRFAASGVSFGPRPGSIRSAEGGDPVRLLPQGGRERS